MKRLIVTTALLLSLCSCNTTPKPKPDEASTFRAPSATELFDLQSKCSLLGAKILEGNFIGKALTQEQVSHYNPKDNRCYVKLTVSSADLMTPPDKYTDDNFLYDGQSKEMLAYATGTGQKKASMVFDVSMKKILQEKKESDSDFYAVNELIDSFVATERKP